MKLQSISGGILAVLFLSFSLLQVKIVEWIPQWGKSAQLVMLPETEDTSKDIGSDNNSKSVDLMWEARRHTLHGLCLLITIPAPSPFAGDVINFPSDQLTPPPEGQT